uniref:HDC09403 n=1 Tax=Drosophila melanogaster TaxID=7227 RepID=Q6ILI5_DROME|nr:TPA_inf: HDC09403 [Drosophila melanogaster]
MSARLCLCVCVCVIARVCEWGKTSGNNNTGDDDNDLQLHVFFTISRTSLDFGLPDTLTALNENDGQEEFARLTDTLRLTISTRATNNNIDSSSDAVGLGSSKAVCQLHWNYTCMLACGGTEAGASSSQSLSLSQSVMLFNALQLAAVDNVAATHSGRGSPPTTTGGTC